MKPKAQTKEEIEAELHDLRFKELADFASTLVLQIIAVTDNPTEAVQVATMVLGNLIGNSVKLEEAALKELLGNVTTRIEGMARKTMTQRANIEAVAKIFGGPHEAS